METPPTMLHLSHTVLI